MARTSSGRLVKLSLQLPPEQQDWLAARAERQHTSVASVVRQIVAAAMERELAEQGDGGLS